MLIFLCPANDFQNWPNCSAVFGTIRQFTTECFRSPLKRTLSALAKTCDLARLPVAPNAQRIFSPYLPGSFFIVIPVPENIAATQQQNVHSHCPIRTLGKFRQAFRRI